MGMRVIVCGGRDYDDYDFIIKSLDALNVKHGISLLIEGGAKGADAHGAIWADNNKIPRCTMHANWNQHGNAAGPIRNRHMIELLSADCVVAFHGGRGTKNMVEQAKSYGVNVWDLRNA